MMFSGQLLKMISENTDPVQYYLNLSGDLISINQLISKKITIKHIGYKCISCGIDEMIFRMGFCKKCFFESPYASESIIRPELSKAHLGIEERDLDIEKKIQLVPHIVYLSYTGGVKVGVTRNSQIPTRWIDQGATLAVPIAKTENRFQAGLIEVALKKSFPDKTNWKKMLQNTESEENLTNLERVRINIKKNFPDELIKFYTPNEDIYNIKYPYNISSKEISSLKLNKESEISGTLKGIKGQYLHFDGGLFFNVRKHEGYTINLSIM